MKTVEYSHFLESKRILVTPSGFSIEPKEINPMLFDFQRDIVIWALKKGKAAIFAGTGLGKTPIQLEWCKHVISRTSGNVLILSPLAVAQQTVREGKKFGIKVTYCRSQEEVVEGVNITNYEMLHKFDTSQFIGIVLDESSILKAFNGKTRTSLIEAFQNTPYKLACTATPAPNDHMELGNHSEFLGVMNRVEMLATYFMHDSGNTSKWRLKRHARQDFWNWVASWAVMISNPHDLGYDDDGFLLPPLKIQQIVVDKTGYYVKEALGLLERRQARRESVEKRVSKTAEIVNGSKETWLIWCDLNIESSTLVQQIDDSMEIQGSDEIDYKIETMTKFNNGDLRILITKPSIAGFGLNWQHCHNVIFVGLSDSFEQYYQAVRRCWRFGQKHSVNVYLITSERELL